jgi:hypothetical protein
MATQEGAEQYGGQYATDLVPFQMLDAGTAEWDRPYRDDIRRLAAELEAKREKRGDLR